MTLASGRGMSDLPPSDKAQHDDHQDEQYRQHEQGYRRAVRDIAGEDADLKTLEAEHRGSVDRAAIGQQIDDAQIGKGKGDSKNQADDDDRRDHRYDDLV